MLDPNTPPVLAGTLDAASSADDTPAPLGGPVSLWTDGSCQPNPGAGGYAAILRNDAGRERIVSGGDPNTTNNRMELLAVIRGLEALKRPCRVTVHLDSELVFLGMTERAAQWEARGWRTRQGKPVANADLWMRLLDAAKPHVIEWRKVKGHGDDAMNAKADTLANQAREKVALAFHGAVLP